MRLLQRYILGELLRVFTLVLSALTVLLLFVGVFREMTEKGLGPDQALQILPYVAPSLLPFTIPATYLLTVCVVYGRMSADQEITAARAAGVNILSLIWPSFFLGGILSVLSFAMTDRAMPWAVQNIQRTIAAAMEDIFLDTLRTQNFFIDPNHGIEITVMGVQDRKLLLPTFRYAPSGKSPVTVQAESATLDFDPQRGEVVLHLVQGHIDVPGQRHVTFEREDRAVPFPVSMQSNKPQHRSFEDIDAELANMERNRIEKEVRRDAEIAMAFALGDFERFHQNEFEQFSGRELYDASHAARLKTELNNRVAMSFSCLFFVFLGSPFSILQARREFLTNFFLCFLPILLVYYPVVLLMQSLSKEQMIDPRWAMWVGNALIGIAAAAVLRKLMRT